MQIPERALVDKKGRRLYRIRELSLEWGVSEKLVRGLIGRRALDAVRLGRLVMVPADSANRYLEENTTPARVA
jgi:hypothetical protein